MRRQAAIVLAAILCLTGCGAGEPAAKPTAKTKTSTSQTLPKSQREALKRQAIQTARDLHEWGADSTIDVTTLNRLNAADAAGRLKGFLADARPDSLSDLTVDESAGARTGGEHPPARETFAAAARRCRPCAHGCRLKSGARSRFTGRTDRHPCPKHPGGVRRAGNVARHGRAGYGHVLLGRLARVDARIQRL